MVKILYKYRQDLGKNVIIFAFCVKNVQSDCYLYIFNDIVIYIKFVWISNGRVFY